MLNEYQIPLNILRIDFRIVPPFQSCCYKEAIVFVFLLFICLIIPNAKYYALLYKQKGKGAFSWKQKL